MNLRQFLALLLLVFPCLHTLGQSNVYICLGNADLVKVDPGFCNPKIIGNMKVTMYDVALSPSGILYGVGNNRLYKIDTATAKITEIGMSVVVNSLVCDKKGRLFGAFTSLYQIDPATGKYKDLGKLKHSSTGDLTFFNDTMYMAGTGNELIRVSYTPDVPGSAVSTFIGKMNISYPVFGVITVNILVKDRLMPFMYACSGKSLYEVNRFSGILKSQCLNMEIDQDIFGAASVAEFIPYLNLPRSIAICTTPFTIKVGEGWHSYLWSTGDTTRTITQSKTGKYWVKATYGNFTVTDTVIVDYGEKREVFAGNDTSICEGQTAKLTAAGKNIARLIWSNGSELPSITVKPDSTTTYYVTGSNPGCPDVIDSVTVNIIKKGKFKVSKDVTICEGETTSLQASSPDNFQYIWSTGDTTAVINVQPESTATYYVTAKSFPCPDQVSAVTVKVIKKSKITAGEDITICEGETATLHATGQGFSKVLWSTGDTNSVIAVQPGKTTSYLVTGKSTYCPEIYDTVTVFVNKKPEADFYFDPLSGVFPLNASLKNTSSGSEKIKWIINDQETTTSNADEVLHQFKMPGIFGITLIAFNKNCSDTVTKFITVRDTFLIRIPDVFSPNSDKLNESWRPVVTGIKQLNVKIFNRWGEEIYVFSMPAEKGWDGSCKGSPVPEGEYLYMLEILDFEGNIIYKSGRIYLVR